MQDISNDFRIAVFKIKITTSTTGNKEGKYLKLKFSSRDHVSAQDSRDKTRFCKTAT